MPVAEEAFWLGGWGSTLSLVGYIHGVANTSATIQITLPVGSAAGDLIVGAGWNIVGNTTTPTGYTLLDGPTASDSAEVRSFYKVLDATDIANGYTTMPGDPGFNGAPYSLWVWHGNGGTPTIDGHSTRQASDLTSPTIYNSGTVTTAASGDGLCVAMAGRGGSAPTAWSSTPSDVTIDQNSPASGAGAFHLIAWHYSFAGSGPTSDQTASLDSANDREHSMVIAIAGPAVTITGSAAITLGDFIAAASGSTVVGTSAQTLGAFVSAATGGFGPSGTAAITLGAFVSAASGSSVVGSSAITLAAFVSAATGAVGASGTAAVTLGAFVSAATGGFGPSGTAAITLAAFVSAASGSTVVGSAAITLDVFVSAASGTADPPGAGVTGSAAITLGDFIAAASGSTVVGSAAITLDAFTSVANGTGGPDIAVVSSAGSYPTTSLHRHLGAFWALDSFAGETVVIITGRDRRADEEALAALGAI